VLRPQRGQLVVVTATPSLYSFGPAEPYSAAMDKRTTVTRAAALKQLHAEHRPLVLPTVWDVWSARVAADAGFTALTIGSHPLAEARGAEDHEGQTFDEVIAAVRPIIAAVEVPVSVDLEAGYGQEPADLIAGLVDAGGVGLNLEDTVHSEGGRLRTTREHAQYIGGLRAAADNAGVGVFLNGRTDLFMHADDANEVLDEAIERLRALVDAGADSVYPVRIQSDDGLIRAVVEAVDVPVNTTAHPVKHDLERFRRLGVGRITFGPLLQAALTDATQEMLAAWR
jgi:2-methylisocitrate lyase-like PEP mutase family enzyme